MLIPCRFEVGGAEGLTESLGEESAWYISTRKSEGQRTAYDISPLSL